MLIKCTRAFKPYLRFIDSRDAVGDEREVFVGDGSGKAGQFFHAYLFPPATADEDDFVPHSGARNVADVYHGLVHRYFADDRSAPAAHEGLGAVREVPDVSVGITYR